MFILTMVFARTPERAKAWWCWFDSCRITELNPGTPLFSFNPGGFSSLDLLMDFSSPPFNSLLPLALVAQVSNSAPPETQFTMVSPVQDLPADNFNSFSYDYFQNGGLPTASDVSVNVFVDLNINSIGTFANGTYDCRYDQVPPPGEPEDTWITESFDSTFTGWDPGSVYGIVGAGGCETSIGGLAPADIIQSIAVNAGNDTSDDNGLIAGFDNIIIDLASGRTTYDFTDDLQEYLQFQVHPSSTQVGSSITPAVQVAYYDGNTGTIDTSFTGPITLSLGNNPGGATLNGLLTTNAVAGIATFSDLSLNNVGTAYTVVASANEVIPITSNLFNITAPVVESAPAVAAAPAIFADSAFLSKTVDKTVAQTGNTLTFTINFGNPKGITLNNVVIADTLDNRLTNIHIMSSSLGTPVINGNNVILQGISLLPGQQAMLVISAEISSAAKPGDTISNTASLESPDASIHFSNVALTTILPGSLPATGESPLSDWRLPGLLLLASTFVMIAVSINCCLKFLAL